MASLKNQAEVTIGGKVYTLSGLEQEAYLQKVASYLDYKLSECTANVNYRKQSAEIRSILLALNVADDYFKIKDQVSQLENDAEEKDKEIYDLKHDLIISQIKCENLLKELGQEQGGGKEHQAVNVVSGKDNKHRKK